MKKQQSTFSKITKVVVWVMIFVTIAGVALGALSAFSIF
ncbi:DUF4044 domain-containing protein [Lapidilactobacillus mulanensis]|uniref:DUF4044 domain-containing protein n=1 Tax=Lapidilactobacillus mulanensis TaxID=2485999 RepID=A0ABW4DQM3_9LACO|nr:MULTISPECIES: DUF4044 domain-containing protein [Lapidilactobacillus]